MLLLIYGQNDWALRNLKWDAERFQWTFSTLESDGYHWEEETMTKNPKKTYVKPEVRKIKLSLAELTLGTNCDINNDLVMASFCPPNATVCNI